MHGDKLNARLNQSEVVLLDGAVGTQLQVMGVPMDNTSWAAMALQTHPDTVRHMHRKYIECGVDVITTNTYSSARHNLEPLGLGDLTRELNLRAVNLACEARDRHAGRDVFIAGSVSNFGIVTQGEEREALHRYARKRSAISTGQATDNLNEQAEILADAGVDLLLVESTGSMVQRRWVFEACLKTGMPTWLGFRARVDPGADEVYTGYTSRDTLDLGLAQLLDAGSPDAVAIFHSTAAGIDAALPVVRRHWSGPIVAYPEAERSDYTAPQRNSAVPTNITPDEFVRHALGWVEQGVQVVGGCCGIDVDYIRPLREALPPAVSGRPRRS